MPKATEDAAHYRAAIKDLFRKMDRNAKERERLRVDTERLKKETREILARITTRQNVAGNLQGNPKTV